ncbi:MAG: ABC transporter permease [Acidobacteriota bacterium]
MKLPAWCCRLLGWIVPEDRRGDVLGDLEEVHRRRLAGIGTLRAWLSTSAEALLLAGTFVLYRLRDRGWGLSWISWTEVKLGLRLIRKQPILAATTILALAMGIAVATTAFTFVDVLHHGELPFAGGDRFVRLEVRTVPAGWSRSLDLERHHLFKAADSFEHFGAYDRVELNLLHPSGSVESALGAWITPSSFRFLPYRPIVGRSFTPADGAPGAPPVVLLRESLWQRRYGGDREVIGQTLNVGGRDYTVIGVLADTAGFPCGGELWLPLDETYLGGTAAAPKRGLTSFGVLDQEVSLESARQEIAGLSAAFIADHPPTEATRLELQGFVDSRPQERLTASVMMAVPILLLVVIAANVANLILARTEARTGELAVRTALGADRSRLIGQLAVEVTLLGAIAAGLGLLVSRLAIRWLMLHLDAPFWFELRINPRILVFVLGVTLLTSVVGGVVPALKATRRDTASALQTRGRLGGRFGLGRVGATMTVVEMALAVAMLSGALIIARGLTGIADRTFDIPRGTVLTARIFADPQPAVDAEGAPLDLSAHLSTRVARALEGIPGVVASGIGSQLPGLDAPDYPVAMAPEAGETAGPTQMALLARVKPGFFDTFAARTLAGRRLRDSDLRPEAPPVAVVNEPFVRKFLGGRNPIGRRLRIEGSTAEGQAEWREIVGVVPDLGLSSGDPARAAGFYIPHVSNSRAFYLALRTDGDPTRLAGPLRQAVAAVDPGIRVTHVAPLEEVKADTRALVAGFGNSLIAMGGLVMLLSLVGIYAMISFAVTRQTREIGIRIALGATRGQVLRTLLRGASLFLVLGGGLGIVLSLLFMQIKDGLLDMRLPSQEPWVIPAVLGLLLLAGLAACWAPARRALRIAPSEALRFD